MIGPFTPKEYVALLGEMSDADYNKERQNLSKEVKQAWAEVETSFLPTRSKYA